MTRPAIIDQDVVVVPREPVAWHIQGSSTVTKDHDVTDRWRLGNPSAAIEPLYASPHADAWADVRAYVAGLEDENGRLDAELDDALSEPWPEWASSILKTLKRHGYDPADDDGTVDLAAAFSEYLEGIEQEDALYRADIAASEARITELEARLKEAERVLKPFAKAPYMGGNAFNRAALSDNDFRAARTFMEGSK